MPKRFLFLIIAIAFRESPPMASVEVIPVRRRSKMKAFINLPWRIYRDNPNWVPPIKWSLARLLNHKKYPFWRFSERELFLARRGSEVVYSIAAILPVKKRISCEFSLLTAT